MTNAQQHQFWLAFHRFQMRYELMYAPKINEALKSQVKSFTDSNDITHVHSAGMYGVLNDLYKTTGSVWARHTTHELRQRRAGKKYGHRTFQYKGGMPDIDTQLKEGGQMGFSERIVSLMQQYFSIDLLNDAENITQTTIRLIQNVLSESALLGWSFDQIVAKLVSPDFTAKRARLIARTETVGAANAGSMVNAKATGLELNKIWISARDSRVRLHHKEVNQMVVPRDGKFEVGGFLMDHPGDKAGGAAEVCNCRCCIAFIPV